MYLATVTNQNQITIPAKVRQQQGIKPGDQVVFISKNTKTFAFHRLLPARNTFGLLKAVDRGQTYDPHAVWNQSHESK